MTVGVIRGGGSETAPSNDDVEAAYEDLWKMQQESLKQQRADTVGDFYTQLGLHKAGQEAENALSFLGEWQKAVNGNIEATASAQAEGIPAPQSIGVPYGSLFENNVEEDRWETFGNILGGGSGG